MDAKTKPFDEHYQKYEDWFKRNDYAYQSELKAVKNFIPDNKRGLEIGVGSGKFAAPLGIKTGVEPSKEMRKLAEERGIEVYDAVGESLPFENDSFDFVLMVTTICFLTDIDKSFQEVKRVLKERASFVIGFVDEDSPLGREYLAKKEENVFYREATFYTTDEVLSLLDKYGFSNIEIVQTIFGPLSTVNKIQHFEKGYGDGGFAVIKAEK